MLRPTDARYLSPRRRALAGQAGFSLPELMVVIAIIMLLATLSIPSVRRARQRAEEGRAAQTMRDIHTAQEAYRITNGMYAPNFKTLQNVGSQFSPGEAETGGGSAGEDVMVFQGYIFRLNRTAPTEYTVIAEPVNDRSSRTWWGMNQLGVLSSGVGELPGEFGGTGVGVPPPEEEGKEEKKGGKEGEEGKH